MNGKVRIGFFSFTEITDPAEHRSYNEWHMYDHMPEQFPIGGIVYGQRWVSTPACTASRAASSGPLAATHYLTLYLMSDPVRETLREFYEHGRALAKLGRFHQHRRALLSGPFLVTGMAAAPRVLVRAEAVPYRPHSGVYVIVGLRAPRPRRARRRRRAWLAPGRSPAPTSTPISRGRRGVAGSRSVGSTATRTVPRSRRRRDR